MIVEFYACLFLLFFSFAIIILLLLKKNDESETNKKLIEINDKLTNKNYDLIDTNKVLESYYNFSDNLVRDLFTDYTVYKESGIDNMIKHKYAGEDATIQHFLKNTLGFDKSFREKINIYNTTVGDLFEADKESQLLDE